MHNVHTQMRSSTSEPGGSWADGTLRRYDLVARKPDGSIVGIEVKSGTATRTAQQKLIDNELLDSGGLDTVGDRARSIGIDRIDTVELIKVK